MVIVLRKVHVHLDHVHTGHSVAMLDKKPVVIRDDNLMASPENLIFRFTPVESDRYCAVWTTSKPKDVTGAEVLK